MTASEDSAPPLSTAAAGAAETRDDLEHWLSDLRTDVAADPSGWIGAEPHSEDPSGWIDAEPHGEDPASQPPGAKPNPPGEPETSASRPAGVGRHRTPD